MPYLGAPIYLLYVIFLELSDRDKVWDGWYTIVTVVGWMSYIVFMQFYSTNVLASLYNFWMIIKAQNSEPIKANSEEDPNSSFYSDVQQVDFSNLWIIS